MRPRLAELLLFLFAFLASIFTACAVEPASDADSTRNGPDAGTPRTEPTQRSDDTSGTADRTPVTPSPTPTPPTLLQFPGMVLDLSPGDFWAFRWEFVDQSCAQGSGCSTDNAAGEFQVTLGQPRTIDGVEMFAVGISGQHVADDGSVDLAPSWDYLGSDRTRLLASDGFTLTTIFEAESGEWTGGGFFSRFGRTEDHAAGSTSIGTQPFAEWNGVRTGPAISVVRSDSESECELIEGRRICPREESFSITEAQYYREGVGPIGYTHRSSFSFSGGGFFSSSSSEETVAVVRSSMRGETAAPTPTPVPSPTPTPVPVVHFGPADGSLTLNSASDQIPDFGAGVNLATGAVSVTFTNPSVGSSDWSYGITFRQSAEEEFHAVYVMGSGMWQHFSRGGSVRSQLSTTPRSVSMDRSAGGENTITVIFNETDGEFYLNGELVATLDLSTSNARTRGDVRVMTGILNTDVYDGSRVNYYDLTVRGP